MRTHLICGSATLNIASDSGTIWFPKYFETGRHLLVLVHVRGDAAVEIESTTHVSRQYTITLMGQISGLEQA